MMRAYLRYALFFAVAIVLFMQLRPRPSGPEVDAPAAPFELSLVGTDQRFVLAKERGKPILIEVFAGWCSACRSASPTISAAALAERTREVRFLGVSMDDSSDEAARIKARWGIPYDVALDDGRFSKSYGIKMLPTFVLIDADGHVRKVSTGAPRAAELERWLTLVGAPQRNAL
jgi:thiol-disulfide isomerase/thioredoxin